MSDDLRLSVSKVKCFSQCKKQFEFNYILKFPKKERDYHITGKFCHRVLEWFHQQYIDGCLLPYHISMNDAFKIAWSEYKEKMTPEMKKECWEIINNYLKKISKENKSGTPFNIIKVEQQFNFNITPNLILNGAIDVIRLSDDNVLEVADYKTSKKGKKYLEKDFFQLMTYAFIILQENPDIKVIRGTYILLRHDFECISKDFHVEEILEMKQKYIDYAERILSEKEYKPTTSILCGWCNFLDSCVEGQKQARVFSGETSWD